MFVPPARHFIKLTSPLPQPVHFDVFMKLATDMGLPAKRASRLKVRAFLDQKVRLDILLLAVLCVLTIYCVQAIHFYGENPTRSRTKRTRYP